MVTVRPRPQGSCPWGRGAALAAVLVVAVGCSPGPDLAPVCGPPFPSNEFQQPFPVALEREPVVVDVNSPLVPQDCSTAPLRAEARVLDPFNRPVAATVVVARSVFGGVTATVSLTPEVAGDHLVRVTFEPSLGVVQQLLPVALDRRGVVPRRLTLPAGVPCPEAFWLRSEVLVCALDTDVVVLVRDGREVARFPGGDVTTAGDVIWSSTPLPRLLQRRSYADGGVHLDGTLMGVEVTRTASRDTPTRAFRRANYFNTPHANVWWDGARLLTQGVANAESGFFDGDTLWTFDQSTGSPLLCREQLCTRVGLFLGVTREGVWFLNPGVSVARRPFSPGASRAPLATGQLSLFGASVSQPVPPASDVVPRGTDHAGRTVLPVVTADGPRLELWPEGTVLGVDDAVLLTLDGDRKAVLLYPR